MNFERAAELTAVPDDRIRDHNALRPYRSERSCWRSLMTSSIATGTTLCRLCSKRPGYIERKKLKGDD